LDEEAVGYLAALGVQLVGTDYLSIEASESPSKPVHRILLRKGIAVLEGLDLSGVEEGFYTLIALPLPMPGLEGSPVRAVLLKGEPEIPIPGRPGLPVVEGTPGGATPPPGKT